MQTPAGQQQQIIKMDASLLLGFGPRLPMAVKRLKSQFMDTLIL
jgi:iron complex transport system substrate-binding protein